MEQLVDLINKIFQKQSTAMMVGIIGVAAAFAFIMLCGVLIGDFVKAKRALRLVAIGRLEDGAARLRQITHKEEDGICFDLAIMRPFDYSLTKKMPALMLVSTVFFTGLSLFASLSLSGIFTGYTVIAFLAPGLFGLALCALTLAVKSSMLKTATLDCYKAMTMMSVIPVTQDTSGSQASGTNGQYASSDYDSGEYKRYNPNENESGEYKRHSSNKNEYVSNGRHGAGGYAKDNEYSAGSRDDDALPAEILSLCARIEDIALEGGADHRTLSKLYSEIKDLQQKANTPQAEAKLAAALEVLIVLVDSAL